MVRRGNPLCIKQSIHLPGPLHKRVCNTTPCTESERGYLLNKTHFIFANIDDKQYSKDEHLPLTYHYRSNQTLQFLPTILTTDLTSHN